MIESESHRNEPAHDIDPELLAMLAAVKRQPSGFAPGAPPFGSLPSAGVQRDMRFTVWLVGGILGAVIMGTIWFTSVNTAAHATVVLQAKVDALEKSVESIDRAVALNTKELFSDDRKAMIKQHIEMWSMLERGESNQDAFFAKKGFYSPSDPRSKVSH